MIKINTTRFGTLETEKDKVLFFPEGLLGFPDLHRYILLDHKDTTLKWLQSLDDPDIAFIVISPDSIAENYSIEPDRTVKQFLQLEDLNDLAVLVIMRVQEDDVYANFQGPILLNSRNRKGLQVVMDSSEWEYKQVV